MKTYSITIDKDFLTVLEEAVSISNNISRKPAALKLIGQITGNYRTQCKFEISVDDDDDTVFMFIGFYLERQRDLRQRRHYNLHDINTLNVDVPEAFFLVCKTFNVLPADVLALFAGDVSQHPFITGGSDEREMAKSYFLRAYAPATDEDAEDIFTELYMLRGRWQGNNHQDEFKQLYRDKLEELAHLLLVKQNKG